MTRLQRVAGTLIAKTGQPHGAARLGCPYTTEHRSSSPQRAVGWNHMSPRLIDHDRFAGNPLPREGLITTATREAAAIVCRSHAI